MADRTGLSKRVQSVAVAVGLVVVGLALLFGGGLVGPEAGSEAPAPVPTTGTSGARTTASQRDPQTGLLLVELRGLPREVQETVALIQQGGPYPYRQDGATFGNREGLLPVRPRGFYREFTVDTSGSDDRGARRIVTGDPERQFFYTADHYNSFVQIRR